LNVQLLGGGRGESSGQSMGSESAGSMNSVGNPSEMAEVTDDLPF
jgi:hypothetical protein